MKPWQQLDRVPTPSGNSELTLSRRGDEYSIRVGYDELMNSRVHGSEEAMAELTCARFANTSGARVLVGGLGMGFTLAATNAVLGDDAAIEVAELVDAVIRWNRGPLGECAGHPLQDPRVVVRNEDVCETIRRGNQTYDAVLLDVDNGPDGLTEKSNGWLYRPAGLAALGRALKPVGVACFWSAAPDASFNRALRKAGYRVDERTVRARKNGKGPKHTLWLAEPHPGRSE